MLYGHPTLLITHLQLQVSIARWKPEEHHANQRFIIVEGENLLFLREAVSVTGSHGQDPWKIGKQSDNILMIYDPNDSDQKEPKDSGNAISMVIIKTAFGEISHPILRAEVRFQVIHKMPLRPVQLIHPCSLHLVPANTIMHMKGDV